MEPKLNTHCRNTGAACAKCGQAISNCWEGMQLGKKCYHKKCAREVQLREAGMSRIAYARCPQPPAAPQKLREAIPQELHAPPNTKLAG
jgi:hypothetical protein